MPPNALFKGLLGSVSPVRGAVCVANSSYQFRSDIESNKNVCLAYISGRQNYQATKHENHQKNLIVDPQAFTGIKLGQILRIGLIAPRFRGLSLLYYMTQLRKINGYSMVR